MRGWFVLAGLLGLAVCAGLSGAREGVLTIKQKQQEPPELSMRSGQPEWLAWINPAAGDTNAVKTSFEGPVAGDTTITFTDEESAVIDYARNITLTVAGTQANVDVGTVTLTGTNILNQTITEDYAFTENMAAGTLTGAKAFKSVSSLAIHQQDGGNVLIAVGIGVKFGLPQTDVCNPVVFVNHDGTRDSTAGTVTVSGSAVESNGITFATAPTGTKDYHVYAVFSPFSAVTAATRK